MQTECHCDFISRGGQLLEGEYVRRLFLEGYQLGDFREDFNIERARSADDYWNDFFFRFQGVVGLKGQSKGLVDAADVVNDVCLVCFRRLSI